MTTNIRPLKHYSQKHYSVNNSVNNVQSDSKPEQTQIRVWTSDFRVLLRFPGTLSSDLKALMKKKMQPQTFYRGP